MQLVFADDAFREECNSQDRLVKRLGLDRARILRQRLDELFNAEVLEDMRSLPHVSIVNPLTSGDLELDLGHPFRLAFKPLDLGGRINGVTNWKKIDSIMIVGLRRADAKSRS